MALQDINRNDIFFENVVRAALEDNKADVRNVVLVNESMATVKGQNFFSTMKRLHLKYSHYQKNNDCSNETTEKTITLILKEEPTDILLLEQVRSLNLFGTELPILEDVLPEIEKLICRKIGPKFLYGNAKKSQIIMEDLCALGFKNIDAPLGFSEAHTLMVIEELAKFHAGSVALNEMVLSTILIIIIFFFVLSYPKSIINYYYFMSITAIRLSSTILIEFNIR